MTEKEYRAALQRIGELMGAESSEEIEQLEALVTLVEKYEDENHAWDD